jgi:hypothetical protein
MNELVDATTFKWILTILTGALAGVWVLYDIRNLVVTRKLDRSDPVVRDRHFGYVMGIVIGVVGVIGCLKFHGVV